MKVSAAKDKFSTEITYNLEIYLGRKMSKKVKISELELS